MRALGTEDGNGLNRLALVLQGLDVVRKRQQVNLGTQLHRRVSPVAVGEDAELSAGGNRLDLVLRRLERLPGVTRPVGQAFGQGRGLLRVGRGNLQDVHIVQGGQVIEVHNVVVQPVVNQNEIAYVLRVQRNLKLQCIFHRTDASNSVHRGAHAAEALGKQPGFPRVAALEDVLNAAPHRAGGPGIRDCAVFHFHVDAEVAFNPADGVDRYAFRHVMKTFSSMSWINVPPVRSQSTGCRVLPALRISPS